MASSRLHLYLSSEERRRIARAAALAGLSVSAFVRAAVLCELDGTEAAPGVTALSPAESGHFLASLRKPFSPNAALRRAIKRGSKLGV